MDFVPFASAAAALCFCLLPAAAGAQRLPGTVVPEHYTLHLTPDIHAKTFAGTESIRVRLTAPIASITLNAAELKISSVQAAAGNQQLAATVAYQPKLEQAVLTFPQHLPAGPVELRIQYTGILNDELRGFYLSHTAKRDYAVTQFEATDARRAFPSFDEPALKATFDLSLTVDHGDTVIANTPMLSDTPAENGRHTETFATTPRMSTYLLAFQVGDWACIKGGADGIPIRVCSTPDKANLTQYALSAAEHLLHYYDTYFGVKYALPKLDLIGIPDFAAGAMENWGCITYRETLLLVSPQDSLAAHHSVVSVVAHEMAHQWFGDLVTAEWWNNIWLNEGFATWMAAKATGEYQPGWNEPEAFAQELNSTLNLDAAHATRTIRSKADTPTEIGQQFDGLSYGKAGAVIGMVEHLISPPVFQRGVHNYMEAHKFSNATAEDFWGAETAASGQPVDKIMESLIAQPGVPLLHFAAPAASGTPVTQSRFFLNPIGAPSSQQTWTLPVCPRGEGACTVISGQSSTVPSTSPTLLNAAGIGYFRSEYTPATFHALSTSVSSFSPTERIVFLGDTESLMRANLLPAGELLSLMGRLHDDPSGHVLDQVITSLMPVSSIATGDQRRQLDTWFVHTFGPTYRALPPASATEQPSLTERRLALFTSLGLHGDPAVFAEAQSIADRFLANDPSAGSLGPSALHIAAVHGDAAFYQKVLAASEAPAAPNVHVAEINALGDFSDPKLVDQTVQYSVSGKLRKQDFYRPLAILLSDTNTRDTAWDSIRAHWQQVSVMASSGIEGNPVNFVIRATRSFCSAEKESEVRDFFTAHAVEGSKRPLTESLSAIQACTELRSAQSANLNTWLSSTR